MTCVYIFGVPNVTEIEGLLFPGFGKRRHSMENWFFPSSDVTRALKNFQLKSSIFELPRDVTWWEKPVFHGARTFANTWPKPRKSKPSISITLGVPLFDHNIGVVPNWMLKTHVLITRSFLNISERMLWWVVSLIFLNQKVNEKCYVNVM